MICEKKVICIIPARLDSTRLHNKILVKLLDKPLLQWVWFAAKKVSYFDDVVFAIDSEKAANLIRGFGGKYFMTSLDCACGTDRLVELALSNKLQGDLWVNWQADEPFINELMIKDLLQGCQNDVVDVWTLRKKICVQHQIASPNVVKVVCDVNGKALYFSRSQIPFYRNAESTKQDYYKHIGIYAFTLGALKKISKLEKSSLEEAEKLEQLRFLQNGLVIKANVTNHEVIGIDTLQDLQLAETYAKEHMLL